MDIAAEWTRHAQRERLAVKDEEMAAVEEFAALVERNARRMFRVAYSLMRNSHDAEDAVQEAFLKLHRGGAWRRMEDERAFLARTVWRVALDRVQGAAGRSEDVEGMEIASGGKSPEEWAASGDERELLRQMIDRLPEDLRRPLVLSAIEEMTSGEVAVVMGIPEGTVRTRVMRAKAELKKRFEAVREVRR
jgi:RNA polymerase sigma-70 factor, ECF subfamily